MQLSAHSRDLLDSSRYTSQRNCSLQVVPMGSVGLLLVYHIFDIIRERISHMDDGEKDVQNSHASNEKNLGCLGRIGGYTTLCYRVYMGLLYPIIGIPMKQPV